MLSLSYALALWLQASESTGSGQQYLVAVLGISILSLLIAVALSRYVISQDTGTAQMQKISNAIKQGAEAFLKRQNQTILGLALVLAVIIYLGYWLGKGDATLATRMTISFVSGALCSTLAGFSGMWVSIRSNIRTASAARTSLNKALQISLRGGAVTGLSVVALSLLGVGTLFWAFDGLNNPTDVPTQIVAFGFGASFVALFAQLGGGIYTKAADVGADLVGKIEAGIPEDDPRNPAVIADLVGDNVGDCAGRGADLFESTAAENIGAMILGVALYSFTHNTSWVFFPLVVRSVGIIASMVGILAVSVGEVTDPQRKLDQGYWSMTVIAAIGIFGTVWIMLDRNYWFALAGLTGLLTSVAFVYITQYYTAGGWRPVQELARASRTGPATNIISGVSVGLESTGITAIIIAVALGLSYFFGTQAAQLTPALAAGNVNPGLFGTAVATMGILTTVADRKS